MDHSTRCIAPNDCCDTADDNWEQDVLNASAEHVGHNAHTSKRIKHKKMNRFKKFGGATPCEIYGYIKPKEAKTFDDWLKDDAATPNIQEGPVVYTQLQCPLKGFSSIGMKFAPWLKAEQICQNSMEPNHVRRNCRRTAGD